jgi:hypothetical protein
VTDEDDDDLMEELPLPPDALPLPGEDERAARWLHLNRRAQLSVYPAEDATYTLYADHPAVRDELATLAAAEAAEHPELEIAALIGDGHLVLAVRPVEGFVPVMSPTALPRPRTPAALPAADSPTPR